MTTTAIDVLPQKILIVLHGSIGDVARAIPLANLLKRKYPAAHLAWAVEPAALAMVESHPAIDEVLLFKRNQWPRTFFPFLADIRRHRFDLVLDLQRHFKSGLISWFSAAKTRIGFHRTDSKEGNWLFNNHHIPPAGDTIPKFAHYLQFAAYLGIEAKPIEWNWRFDGVEIAAAERLVGPDAGEFAVLFVGSRWQSKDWFPEQIAACAEYLAAQHHLKTILLGGRADEAAADAAIRLSGVAVANLAGRTSLRQAMILISRARLAIGPDTGLMHIAAAFGTPVVSLWGATDPQRTGPFGFADLVVQGKAECVPCYRKSCTIGRVCMQSIQAAELFAKIDLGIDRRKAKVIHASGAA